jgi:hypothetical protein
MGRGCIELEGRVEEEVFERIRLSDGDCYDKREMQGQRKEWEYK